MFRGKQGNIPHQKVRQPIAAYADSAPTDSLLKDRILQSDHKLINQSQSERRTLSTFLYSLFLVATRSSGGGRRVRTDDPLLAKQVLSQLSYAPIILVVGQGGLEPPTPRLSSVCSNQLSY